MHDIAGHPISPTGNDVRENGALAHRTIEELEDEIAVLSAHIDAATYQLLQVIKEFDRRKGWECGFISCAHWLSWRIGIDQVTAREKVRVALALAELPLISQAFKQGKVSYSKVRAMVRIATSENEKELLHIAEEGTAAHVEKVVRAYRRVTRNEETENTIKQKEDRYLQIYTDEDGMVVIHGRLPPEIGACVKKSLEAAMEALKNKRDDKINDMKDAPKIDGIDDDALNINNDSAESFTPSGIAVNHDSAEPDEMNRSSFINDSAESPIEAPTTSQLRADALGLVAEVALNRGLDRGERGEAYQVVIHVEEQVLKDPGKEGLCELEHGPAIAAETCRRLACDASTILVTHSSDGDIIHLGRKTRKISRPLWRALLNRDKSCQFPGCHCRRHLKAHHIKHWANGGKTDPENLVLLCRAHHWAVHEGGFRIQGKRPGELVFIRPDGRVLPITPPFNRLPEDAVQKLMLRNGDQDISTDTNACNWDGLAMDYDMAVMGLMSSTP